MADIVNSEANGDVPRPVTWVAMMTGLAYMWGGCVGDVDRTGMQRFFGPDCAWMVQMCDAYAEEWHDCFMKFLPADLYLHMYWAGIYLQWTGNLPEALRLQHEQHVHIRARLSKPDGVCANLFCGFISLHSAGCGWTDSTVDMEDCVDLTSVRSYRHTVFIILIL